MKKTKSFSWGAVAGVVVFLAFIILLENITALVPGAPRVLQPTSQLFTVLKKGAVYCLVVVSMTLSSGFTGLFSVGQAGCMVVGAYTYAILTVPVDQKDTVYYLFGGSAVKFSLQDTFALLFGSTGVGGGISMVLGVLVGLILAGLVAAGFAYLIGLPVLRLKSDYLAIATLGFAEILRAIFQWQPLGPITNGANMLKSFPTFSDFNIEDASGKVVLRLSAFVPMLAAVVCIAIIVLLINSSYGRAFKAIREDEVAAEAMGINLAKHKMLSFCISSFFAGVGGGLFAMYAANAQAKVFTSTMTYELLLIVVIGGIGSVSGSIIATFLYVACSEWWLRFLDSEQTFASPTDPARLAFIAVFAVAVVGVSYAAIRAARKKEGHTLTQELPIWIVALLLLGWLVYFVISRSLELPLLRNGFRMVVFSIIIMIVVLFFRRGIMGDQELPDVLRVLKNRKHKKEASK